MPIDNTDQQTTQTAIANHFCAGSQLHADDRWGHVGLGGALY